MANVYCSECKHFGFYKEKGTLGVWVCRHPSNVGTAVKDDYLSYGNVETFTLDLSVKNADNDCSDYEKYE
jgi:hypothetical protein